MRPRSEWISGAFKAIATFCIGAEALAADPPGTTRSAEHPWVILCSQKLCVSKEQAATDLFLEMEMMSTQDPVARPFGLQLRDARAFFAFLEEWRVADAQIRRRAQRNLCAQRASITSYADLATALAERKQAITQFRSDSLVKLNHSLSSDGRARIDAEIERRRNSGWVDSDGAMHAELKHIEPADSLAKTCERTYETAEHPVGVRAKQPVAADGDG